MTRSRLIVPVFTSFTLLSAVAISGVLSGVVSGVALKAGDEILEIHDTSLTTYIPTSKSGIQDIRSLVDQRGVAINGARRAGSTHRMSLNGNPTASGGAATLNGVRLDTGTFAINDVDLSFPAEVPWIIGRSYNCRQKDSGGSYYVSAGYQGDNWFQSSQPELVFHDSETDAEDMIYLVYGADRFLEFRRADDTGTGDSTDTFRGVNGTAGAILLHTFDDCDLATYYDQRGMRYDFFWFDDADIDDDIEGSLWRVMDLKIEVDPYDAGDPLVTSDGNTAYVGDIGDPNTAQTSGYDGSTGAITEAYDSVGRKFTYDYDSGQLIQVEAAIYSGTWDVVGQVDYTYYGASDKGGDPDDLKTVTLTTPLTDSSVNSFRQKHYRYYEGTYNATTNPGYLHQLKYIYDFEGIRNYDWSVDSQIDGDHLSANSAVLKPYASSYFKYDTDRRIVSMWANGDCGCSGAATGTHEFTYETNGSFSGTSGYDTTWYGRTVVEKPEFTNQSAAGAIESWVTQYFDETGQPLSSVRTDGDPSTGSPETWVTQVVRDSDGVMSEVHSPANIHSYTHSTGAISTLTIGGLVSWVEVVGTGQTRGFTNYRKSSTGSNGSKYLDLNMGLTTRALTVGDFEINLPLTTSRTVYTQAITSGTTGANETTSAYTYHGATSTAVQYLALKRITTTNPIVSTANNGSNKATSSQIHLRLDGTSAFTRAADGIFTYTQYTDGQLTKRIDDVKLDGSFDFGDDPYTNFGIMETSAGWNRTTMYTYDDQGRGDVVTPPSGKLGKSYYSKLIDERLVQLRYSGFDTGTPDTFYGPVSYSVSNHAGTAEFSGTVALTNNESTTALTGHIDEGESDPITAMDLGTLASMSTAILDETGSTPVESRAYFDIPASGVGNAIDNYDVSFAGYNDQGAHVRSISVPGTISRKEMDTLGRTVATYIGTIDSDWDGGSASGTDDMVKVSEVVYDSGNDNSNSFVTKQTAFVLDSTTNRRDATFEHDAKGRVLLVTNPNAPHTFSKYDHMGRLIASGQFSSTASITVGSDDPTTETSNRLALSQTFYDEMGRTWKIQRHKIDDADGSDDDNLQSLMWFDLAGRTVKTDGGQLAKTKYDRLGRTTHQYILARDDDTSYKAVGTVTGDIVLVEQQTTYESSDSDEVLMSATISRHHDDFGGGETTGALDTNADSDSLKFTAADLEGRIQITAMWYEDLGRLESSLQYGTYGGSTFDRDGLSIPARSDTALRTDVTYATSGRSETTTNPRDVVTKVLYDDAGRPSAVIENYVDGTPSGDTDYYIRSEYEDGQKIKSWVDMDGDGVEEADDQITTYSFGTTNGGAAGESVIASEHLLLSIAYPDSGGGTDVESFAYNAQSQMIWKRDQEGNEVETVFDTSGRVTSTDITILDADFDGAVERIDQAYNTLGQLSTVTQYDSAPAIIDQVKYSYDDWGPVSKFEQDHNSAVGGSLLYDIDYAYAKATNGRNTLRGTSTDLPNGDTVSYTYTDDSSHDDDQASRVSKVSLDTGSGAVTVSEYLYNGVGHVVGVDLGESDVMRNLYGATSGSYPDLDRFNRVTSDIWEKDLATDIAFYDVDVTYDRNSNITDLDEQEGHEDFDMLFTMDDRDRLTEFKQGTISGGSISSPTRVEEWILSQTGNWDEYDVSIGGFPVLESTNTHNEVNELTGRDTVAGGGDEFSPTYNDVGGMDDDDENYEYVYDPFGRMRKILNTTTQAVVAEYTYNGLGYRIGWHYDVDDDGDVDGDDEWYRWVYDTNWRIVATYRESDSDPKEQFVYHASSYIDDVILRDKDANTDWDVEADGTLEDRVYYCQNWRHDVIALVDDSGVQVEQARFTPYGVSFGLPAGDMDSDGDVDMSDRNKLQSVIIGTYDVLGDLDLDGDNDADDLTILNANFGVDAGLNTLSIVGNRKGYAGYEFEDALSATQRFYHVRYRVLNSDLGRWTQRDPAGYVDGANLYGYVAGNPISKFDAFGLLPCDQNPDGSGCDGEWVDPWYVSSCSIFEPDLPSCVACCIATADSGLGLLACINSCMKYSSYIPACPPFNPGANLNDVWCFDASGSGHCGQNCYRSFGTGSTGGQQCCYDLTTGFLRLDDDCMGTIDIIGAACGELPNGDCTLNYFWDVPHHLWTDYLDYALQWNIYEEVQCCMRQQYNIPSGSPGFPTSDDLLNTAYQNCWDLIHDGWLYCGGKRKPQRCNVGGRGQPWNPPQP